MSNERTAPAPQERCCEDIDYDGEIPIQCPELKPCRVHAPAPQERCEVQVTYRDRVYDQTCEVTGMCGLPLPCPNHTPAPAEQRGSALRRYLDEQDGFIPAEQRGDGKHGQVVNCGIPCSVCGGTEYICAEAVPERTRPAAEEPRR